MNRQLHSASEDQLGQMFVMKTLLRVQRTDKVRPSDCSSLIGLNSFLRCLARLVAQTGPVSCPVKLVLVSGRHQYTEITAQVAVRPWPEQGQCRGTGHAAGRLPSLVINSFRFHQLRELRGITHTFQSRIRNRKSLIP